MGQRTAPHLLPYNETRIFPELPLAVLAVLPAGGAGDPVGGPVLHGRGPGAHHAQGVVRHLLQACLPGPRGHDYTRVHL